MSLCDRRGRGPRPFFPIVLHRVPLADQDKRHDQNENESQADLDHLEQKADPLPAAHRRRGNGVGYDNRAFVGRRRYVLN